MNIVKQETISVNTGWAHVVKKGQCIRVSGQTIVDFVAFNHENLRERFDPANGYEPKSLGIDIYEET